MSACVVDFCWSLACHSSCEALLWMKAWHWVLDGLHYSCHTRLVCACQAPAKETPKLFNPAMEYDPNCVLLVSLQDKPLTLTAQQVTCLPWLQYVRLIKVSPWLEGTPAGESEGCFFTSSDMLQDKPFNLMAL